MRLFEIQKPSIKSKIAGSQLQMLLYHGSDSLIQQFRKPPSGVFFSPHPEWAHQYGPRLTQVYVWAPKLYIVGNDEFSEQIFDALFDRDYPALSGYIKQLQAQGYHALQTQSDSEMVCAFSNSKIYSAETGEEM